MAHALARHGAGEQRNDQMVAQVGCHYRHLLALSATVTGRSPTAFQLIDGGRGRRRDLSQHIDRCRGRRNPEADRLEADPDGDGGLRSARGRHRVGNICAPPTPAPAKRVAPALIPADTTRIADIRHWLPEAMRYYRPQ